MAKFCRECRETVKWGVARCPRCGEENPTGANPGDVVLVSGGVTLLGMILYGVARKPDFWHWLQGLFSN
jgi:hypothetical protein